MPRVFCPTTRQWGGLVAALIFSVCCVWPVAAQDDSPTVTLRDAEGYEVHDQGWVKSPSFILDHTGDSFTPTVMDIADNAAFDNPTTWSLTDKGGALLHSFNPHDGGLCPGIEAPLRFSTNDKWISSTVQCPFGTIRTNAQTGENAGGYANRSFLTGGIWFRHGGEEVIVWGEYWDPVLPVPEEYEEYSVCVFNAATGERLQIIGAKTSGGIPGRIQWGIVGNVDGSRLYIFAGENLCVLDIDLEQVIKIYDQRITPCKVSRDGTLLMVWNTDGTTDLIDTMTDEIVHTFEDLPPVKYFDAATGNHNVLIVFEDGTCSLINTEKAFPVMPLDFVCDETNTLRLSRNGTVIAKVSLPEGMRLWDLEMNNYLNFNSSYNFQDFSHDGTLIVGLGTGVCGPRREDCNFGKIVTLPSQFRYQSDDLTNGSRTLYVRLRDDGGQSKVLTYNYILDTVGPNAPVKPTAQGGQNDGRVKFAWSPVSDSASGSGVVNYNYRVETAEGASDVQKGYTYESTDVAVPCPTGQTVYCRVRAIDEAGNAGEWSEAVAYYVNAAPEISAITLSPASLGTLDAVTVRAIATDPEGDAIIDTDAQWYLDDVLQSKAAALDPALTTCGQLWQCRARVRDFHGAWSDWGEDHFSILNTPPSQPIVEIKPDPADPDSDLIVDVTQYSVDPDGDSVAYDFKWYKSVDNGETWIQKIELNGSSQVSNLYINDGELWKVIYTPYEVEEETALAKTTDKETPDNAKSFSGLAGAFAWDQVFIGDNQPPALVFGSIAVDSQSGGVMVDAQWTASDADGDAVTVDLYYFDEGYRVLMPIQMDIGQAADGYQGVTTINPDMPVCLHAVVTDAKGSVTHVTSDALSVNTAAHSSWVIYQ